MNTQLLNLEYAELEYGYLLGVFKDYKRPAEKVKYLVRCGDLIPIKRGVYVLSDKYKKLVSTQVLAELIYYPSYLSLESALKYYDLIPESIWGETSTTTKRSKSFQTPLGEFKYHNSTLQDFTWGITLAPVGQGRHVRIASPLKAIYDQIRFRLPNYRQRSDDELFEYIELLRIDFDDFIVTTTQELELEKAKSPRIKEFLYHLMKEYRLEAQ